MKNENLKYVGNGYIFGIPARDLTPAEAKKYGGSKYLIKTGLYKLETKPRPLDNKIATGPKEDK